MPDQGVYQIVVDLTTNKITTEEPNVYLLGQTVGNIWGTDAFIPANKFTVDNEAGTLVSPTFQGKAKCVFDDSVSVLYLLADSPVLSYQIFAFNAVLALSGSTSYVPVGDLPHGIYLVRATTQASQTHTL